MLKEKREKGENRLISFIDTERVDTTDKANLDTCHHKYGPSLSITNLVQLAI